MGTRYKTQCALLWLKKCSQLLFVNLKLFEKLKVQVEKRNIQRQGKKSWFHTTCLVASLELHTHNCSLPVMPISPSLPLLPLLESTSLVYFCTETIIDASVLLGLWAEKIIFFCHYSGGAHKIFHYPTTTKTEDTSEMWLQKLSLNLPSRVPKNWTSEKIWWCTGNHPHRIVNCRHKDYI